MVMILMNDDCNGDNDIKPLPPLQISLKGLFHLGQYQAISFIHTSFWESQNLRFRHSKLPVIMEGPLT